MISRAVVLSWMSALAAVSNWCARNQPLASASSTGLLVHAEALLRARRQHHLGAEEAHQLAPLDREAVGHRHDQRIALRGADHGEPDAGVAAGRLDHGLARLQRAVALGLLDDVERQPVLDRGGRIEELGLHVDRHALGREVVDPDRRACPRRAARAPARAARLPAPLRPASDGRGSCRRRLPAARPSRSTATKAALSSDTPRAHRLPADDQVVVAAGDDADEAFARLRCVIARPLAANGNAALMQSSPACCRFAPATGRRPRSPGR